MRGDGALLLMPGESQLCLKLVEIIDDNIIEADETFSIEFSFIVSSSFPAIPSIISSVTIIDNDMGMYVARTVLLFPLFHSSHLLSLPHSHLCISLFSFLPPSLYLTPSPFPLPLSSLPPSPPSVIGFNPISYTVREGIETVVRLDLFRAGNIDLRATANITTVSVTARSGKKRKHLETYDDYPRTVYLQVLTL